MPEPGRRADLAQEAFRSKRRRHVRAHDLQGHVPVLPEVSRQVDSGHAAVPELALDDVAAREGGRKW